MTTNVTITNAPSSTHNVNITNGSNGQIVAPGSTAVLALAEGQTYSVTQGTVAGGMPSGPDNS